MEATTNTTEIGWNVAPGNSVSNKILDSISACRNKIIEIYKEQYPNIDVKHIQVLDNSQVRLSDDNNTVKTFVKAKKEIRNEDWIVLFISSKAEIGEGYVSLININYTEDILKDILINKKTLSDLIKSNKNLIKTYRENTLKFLFHLDPEVERQYKTKLGYKKGKGSEIYECLKSEISVYKKAIADAIKPINKTSKTLKTDIYIESLSNIGTALDAWKSKAESQLTEYQTMLDALIANSEGDYETTFKALTDKIHGLGWEWILPEECPKYNPGRQEIKNLVIKTKSYKLFWDNIEHNKRVRRTYKTPEYYIMLTSGCSEPLIYSEAISAASGGYSNPYITGDGSVCFGSADGYLRKAYENKDWENYFILIESVIGKYSATSGPRRQLQFFTDWLVSTEEFDITEKDNG